MTITLNPRGEHRTKPGYRPHGPGRPNPDSMRTPRGRGRRERADENRPGIGRGHLPACSGGVRAGLPGSGTGRRARQSEFFGVSVRPASGRVVGRVEAEAFAGGFQGPDQQRDLQSEAQDRLGAGLEPLTGGRPRGAHGVHVRWDEAVGRLSGGPRPPASDARVSAPRHYTGTLGLTPGRPGHRALRRE